MKTFMIGTGVILTFSLVGLTGLTTSKVGTIMTQADVLSKVSTTLEGHSELKLRRVSCSALYGNESPQNRRCYASTVEPETISSLLAQALTPVADTPGWLTDYAVPGAFYQMKAEPKMTFGVSVKATPGSLDLGHVKELKGQESYVTLTVNSQRNA